MPVYHIQGGFGRFVCAKGRHPTLRAGPQFVCAKGRHPTLRANPGLIKRDFPHKGHEEHEEKQ